MISQTAEYALRAVVFLAENIATGQTTDQIAAATQIPAAYLSKVMQQLSRATIVKSQRGLDGGFSLLKPTKKISVLDVINAVDKIERIRECPLGLDAHATKLCALHRRLDEASALVEKAFGQTTIADLLSTSDKVLTFPKVDSKSKKRKGKNPADH